MAPKDFVNIDRNCFNSHFMQMDYERENDGEMNVLNVERTSSIDSLEQFDLISNSNESLQIIGGSHKWFNRNDNLRVEKFVDNYHPMNFFVQTSDDSDSMVRKVLSTNDIEIIFKTEFETEEEDNNEESSLSHMDISLSHFDVQLQVTHGQLQPAVRYGVFSSILNPDNSYITSKISLFKTNQSSQTTDMDMDNDENHHGKTNGYSQNRNYNDNDESDRRNRRTNSSSNNNGNGNGANPNRNNNNSRRSNDDNDDDGSDENNDNDDKNNSDDGDTDEESDENIARRLGFVPLDEATVNLIGRLRHLSNKQLFDRRDFENLQTLIDELIRLQHLEIFSRDQLKRVIHYLKLHRPLQTRSRALIFLQERIPRRAVKYNVISARPEKNPNVFNIWRERERRARLDSKDSLEEEGQHTSGQLRDVVEINNPTPPILLSTNYTTPHVTTKVKQMAKDIDTRTGSTRSEINLRTGERFSDHAYLPRSTSPTYPGLVSVALYDVKSANSNEVLSNENLNETRSRPKAQLNTSSSVSPTPSDHSRVRQMIVRLESSASSPSNAKVERKVSIKKPLHEDQSDTAPSLSSSPPIKRVARREHHEKKLINSNGVNRSDDGMVYQINESNDDVFFDNHGLSTGIKFEFTKEDIANSCQRTASGATMDEYMTTLLPGTETSISMVRDVRASIYEDRTSLSRTDIDGIPIKVDLETLYILEQKSDRKSLPASINLQAGDQEQSRSSLSDRQDFSVQTTIPISVIKPPHRPIGTQVDSTVEQHTVAAQTTDSLHRPARQRQRLSLASSSSEEETKKSVTSTTIKTTARYEIKRRHSSHHDSLNDNESNSTVYMDEVTKKEKHYQENFELKREKRHSASDDHLPIVPDQRPSFGQVTSRIRIDQLRDINRHVVRRHVQDNETTGDEHRSTEVYEIHTRGACKCLVLSYEEKTQYGAETRFEKQLHRIERTYTNEDLKATELHVITTSSDADYQLVRRDYGLNKLDGDNKENENIHDKPKQPTIAIHYYNKEGNRMKTEHTRRIEHLPVVIRCEIEYELNHHGTAQLIILSVTNNERRQMCTSLKKEIVDEIVLRSGGRLSVNSPELEKEITRQFAEPTNLLRLVDYSTRDDCTQTNSTDLRSVTRLDVTTSLRLVQRYRTVVHRLCQLYRAHLPLTQQAEQQRHLILVANDDEYYLLDLAAHIAGLTANILNIRQRQHDIFKREVNNAVQQPFDYAKYRRDLEQQQRILEQQFQQKQMEQKRQYQQTFKTGPPPPGHPSEAEFYLGSERRALIEREIHAMRESIRPHEHAPPRYRHEPYRRSLSISYTGAQRYVRARIIHVKDFYDENQVREQKYKPQDAKEQELFVRVDDYINESAANTLRRSYSTDYLQEDGPRSRVRYIRIPGETIRVEEKTTYDYKGVMYANLPYSLRYWNILYILDREARQGRPLGSSLPHVFVNDPYRTVIPPLTQQEIRQTAQQILSPQYNAKSYTDRTLRWFLSRDNRTEIESNKYLQTLDQYRSHHQLQKKQQQRIMNVQNGGQAGGANKCYITETLVHYEKLPDRLVPVPVPTPITSNDRRLSKENLHRKSPLCPRILQPPNFPQKQLQRSRSQPRQSHDSSIASRSSTYQLSQPLPSTLLEPQRIQLPPMNIPLSRHQSVHELHATPAFSHPPSPTLSLHNLHHNPPNETLQYPIRRPVAFHNRFPTPHNHIPQNPLFTEIIDSQTGRRILTTSQEQLPSEVLGLLDKYNLRQF
ncbi:unnamed protein product [Adineta ricciae]|uniref:Uncharacterized protein n=1 Tax=Adineta ricciae TaxID=249248 RepID=A0A815UCJ1_ADIRI|nr:unnamed protein product [Adineta ricciae]CAF1512139.1 unnamed protein product [Adineta ricciae]